MAAVVARTLALQRASEELAIWIKRVRAAMASRLELVYGPELSTLSEAERTQLLVALDILTDFESWGRLREDHGLSIEAARDLWINAIGRMLPAAAGNPAPEEHQEGPGEGGQGILNIAAEFGVGSGTVQRIKAEMATKAD